MRQRRIRDYYPAPYWAHGESDWVKSLLLFFDRLAILLPGYMYGRHEAADPTLVAPLEERGLLQVLEPDDWVDESMTNELAEIIVELLTNGAFDDLSHDVHFHELSYSRMGYRADVELADFLVDELQARDLAHLSEDGVSVPLHPIVRKTILVILGQLSRARGSRAGLVVHPTTNAHVAIEDLIATLSREPMPSAGRLVALDLEPVSLDLSSIPLDDVLQFRADRRDAHRAYMRDLQRFMVELAAIDLTEEREELLFERRQLIADSAHDIRQSTAKAFKRNLRSWSLGLAGAAWSLGTGDPIGAALGACGLLTGRTGGRPTVTAYSYLFSVQRQLAVST